MSGVYLVFCEWDDWTPVGLDGCIGVAETKEDAIAIVDRAIAGSDDMKSFRIANLLNPSQTYSQRDNGEWFTPEGSGQDAIASKLAAILAKREIEGATAPASHSASEKGGRL